MKCHLCGGAMKKDVDAYLTNLGAQILVVKDIPCHSCGYCGEIYYDDITFGKLEEILSVYKSNLQQDSFVNYNDFAS